MPQGAQVARIEGDHGRRVVHLPHPLHRILQRGHVVQVAGHPLDARQPLGRIGTVVAEDALHHADVAARTAQGTHGALCRKAVQQVRANDAGAAGDELHG